MLQIKLIIILKTICTIRGQFSCKDRDGNSVDWFVGFKLPYLGKTTLKYPDTTLLYADEYSKDWSSPEDLDSHENAVASTLAQYYSEQKKKTTFYMLYNDDMPDVKHQSSAYGHAKGVALFGADSGFWIIHSVPKFPPLKKYSYVANGKRYGQSFLCITFNTTSMNIFVEAMRYINPGIYSLQVPKQFTTRFPSLQYFAIRNTYRTSTLPDTSIVQKFHSRAGIKFTDFAKSRKYGRDLYVNLIAPQVKASLYAETWMNGGAGDLPSECAVQYKVMNVEMLNVTNRTFKNSKDHSKWAIGEKEPVVCLGGINRQQSQTKRGGGAVCFRNPKIWKLYYKSVLEVQNCHI